MSTTPAIANTRHPNGGGATVPGDDLPGNRQLDDALNEWAATGLALLKRIKDRRAKLVLAIQELDALDARTRESIAILAARGETPEP
jgi:hypothetical protein